MTALHYGAKLGHVAVVEKLIGKGANVNAVDGVSFLYDDIAIYSVVNKCDCIVKLCICITTQMRIVKFTVQLT